MVPFRKLYLSRWALAAYFSFMAGVNVCSAQYGDMSYSAQPVVNSYNGYAQQDSGVYSSAVSNSYGAYQPVASDSVDELYRSNKKLPLGGLFAKGFTRTLTVMGGANYANSLASEGVIFDPDEGVPSFDSIFDDPDSGYAISFAFGRRHNHNLRSEIEIAIRGNDLSTSGIEEPISEFPSSDDDNQVTTYSVMKNFIHDFSNRSRLTPYVGVGLGYSYLDIESFADGIDDGVSAFSYQAIGGVATKINKAADIVVEYRFLGTTEVEVADFFPVTYEAHNLFLGVKFEY